MNQKHPGSADQAADKPSSVQDNLDNQVCPTIQTSRELDLPLRPPVSVSRNPSKGGKSGGKGSGGKGLVRYGMGNVSTSRTNKKKKSKKKTQKKYTLHK